MLSLSRNQISQYIISSLVILLCLLAIGGLQIPNLNKLIAREQTASTEEVKREVEAERLRLNLFKRLPALGFDNMMANWVYLGFLQYFGDEVARDQTGYDLSPAYFEIIVERDPHFLPAYLSLTSSVSMFAGQPEQSIALMEKGLRSMSPKNPPKSYFVWRYKAIDELLFLEDITAAKRSHQMAAQWASAYSDDDSRNVAEISRQTAQFLAANPDKQRIKAAQEATWANVILNAINSNDDRTRKQVIRRIEARGGKVTISPEGQISVRLP
jgi:hypothetical protein